MHVKKTSFILFVLTHVHNIKKINNSIKHYFKKIKQTILLK